MFHTCHITARNHNGGGTTAVSVKCGYLEGDGGGFIGSHVIARGLV